MVDLDCGCFCCLLEIQPFFVFACLVVDLSLNFGMLYVILPNIRHGILGRKPKLGLVRWHNGLHLEIRDVEVYVAG